MQLHFLTNENKNLQEKMRFFADYFSYVNEYIGLLPELSLDNCYSLSCKINFQLVNNLENSPIYIENYFSQILSFYSAPSVVKTSLFLLVEKQFLEMKADHKNSASNEKKDSKVKWIKSNPDFIENTQALEEEYKMVFDVNFNALHTYIECAHSLQYHKEAIEYCTRNLVSELRLNGASKVSLDTYIDRILSRTRFPLPEGILQIKNSEIRKAEVAKFMSDRSFKVQFYGFKNLIVAPSVQSGYFIYKIENCRLDKNIQNVFNTQIEQVRFISPFHELLKVVRKSVKENDKKRFTKKYSHVDTRCYPRFFSRKNLLAIIYLNYENTDTGMKDGLDTVTQELSQLNGYFGTNLRVNDNDYLFVETFDSTKVGHRYSLLKQTVSTITEDDLKASQSSPFEILRNIESKAKLHLLSLEKTFFRAVHNTNPALYWIYIENLFWNTKFEGKDEIRRRIARIITNHGLKDIKTNFLHSIVDMLFTQSSASSELGISYEEKQYITNEVYKIQNNNFDIAAYQGKIKNLVFKQLTNYYSNFLSNKQKEKWRIYFLSISLELYEFRNAEVHSGKTNQFHFVKLSTAIPGLVNHLRRILVDGCKMYPQFSFEELIEYLSKET